MNEAELDESRSNTDSDGGSSVSLDEELRNYALLACEAEPAERDSDSAVSHIPAEGIKQENEDFQYQRGEVSTSQGNICEIQVQEDPAASPSGEGEEKLMLINPVLEPINTCDPLIGDQGNEEQLVRVSVLKGISEPEARISRDCGEVYIPTPEFKGLADRSECLPKPIDLIVPNFEGPCKFGVIFPGMENARTPSVYVSEMTNKVFLRMGSTIAVKFTFDPTCAPSMDLYVRATLKFNDLDVIQFPVDRCEVHGLEDDPLCKSHEFESLCKCPYYNLAGHVLRSPTQGSIYCYDPLTRRHSVMNPLKGRSHDVMYSLHCKSSCPKGIDRRPMQVVFTLELLNGAVLGQTSLNVKVCTSPKRDRDRSDAEYKNAYAKRRRYYDERKESRKNQVLVTARRNGNIPSISVVDLESDEQFAAMAKKIREKIGNMKEQLMQANITINRVLQSLNDFE